MRDHMADNVGFDMMISRILAVLGLMVALWGGPVAAATTLCGSKPTGWVNENEDYLCVNAKTDLTSITAETLLFGQTGWTLAAQSSGGAGDGLLSFATSPVSGSSIGSMAILNPSAAEHVLVTLQTASGYWAFLMGSNLASDWRTMETLNYASIYYVGVPNIDPIPQVPLPAAGLLLAGAIGGLMIVRRRRS